MPQRVAGLCGDSDGSFLLTETGDLTWRGARVGRLVRGPALLTPHVEVLRNDYLDNTLREMVRARLAEWLDRHLRKKLRPLFDALDATVEAPARGLVFQLSEQIGSLRRKQVRSLIGTISAKDRKTLTALGVRFGSQSIFFPVLLRPAVLRLRAVLWAAQSGVPVPDLAFGGHEPVGPSFFTSQAPAACWTALGYRTLGSVALRIDRVEKLSAALRKSARKGRFAETARLTALAGCTGDDFAAVAARLGFKAEQLDGRTLFSPKRPPARQGKRGKSKKSKQRNGDAPSTAPDKRSPFAALKTLVPAK